MNTKKIRSYVIAGLMITGFLVALPIFAETNSNNPGTPGNQGQGRMMGNRNAQPAFFGKISTISGTTITMVSENGGKPGNTTKVATPVTYTVDASKATVKNGNTSSSISDLAVNDNIIVQGTISGTTITATNIRYGIVVGEINGQRGISGAVTAISGTSITISHKAGVNNDIKTANYVVDASRATVTKNGVASTVSAIVVGDTVMVQGTVTGTNIVATKINDGVGYNKPEIQGNGQPVVAGKITIINGNIITITNTSNVTYTIDITNAKLVINGMINPTASNFAVGDNLVIQGTVNGNSVVASSVIDQKAKIDNTDKTNNSNDSKKSKPSFMGGMMNGIGNFFKHMFGF